MKAVATLAIEGAIPHSHIQWLSNHLYETYG